MKSALAKEATVTINEQAGGLEKIIQNLANQLLPIVGAIAIGAIIYSGVLIIISQGEPDKLAKAKRSLLWSVVGIIIVSLSYAIVIALRSILQGKILN